jgi:hypothetical protein
MIVAERIASGFSCRFEHSIPANVHRYINLYQSSNVLGGGDLAPARGFHGNYASFNLKNRSGARLDLGSIAA